jgi:FMN hydrolase / 5-amino-6-(5-phospho-D-ribitylamino)uracil phosphatase
VNFDPRDIRAISFDLDDTLWPIWPAIEAAERALIDWFALKHPAVTARFDLAEMRAVRDEVVAANAALGHDLSAIRRLSIECLLERAGADPAAAHEGFALFYAARNRVTLFPDVLPALRQLSARYSLLTLTNGNADLDAIGLAPWFEHQLNARALGVAKPDPRAFAALSACTGLAPAQILHVGDHGEQDVEGARRAGLPSVWINRGGQVWSGSPAPIAVRDLRELDALLS